MLAVALVTGSSKLKPDDIRAINQRLTNLEDAAIYSGECALCPLGSLVAEATVVEAGDNARKYRCGDLVTKKVSKVSPAELCQIYVEARKDCCYYINRYKVFSVNESVSTSNLSDNKVMFLVGGVILLGAILFSFYTYRKTRNEQYATLLTTESV